MSDLAVTPLATPLGQPAIPFDAPTNPYVTVEQFRKDMPAFESRADYPDQSVQAFLDVAGIMATPRRWARMTVMANELLTAHFLALQRYSALHTANNPGSVPGMAIGNVGSKSVSKVSVSYDYSSSQMAGWGPFNLTMYGQQYAFWAQLAGTGGFEVLSVTSGDLSGTVWEWARGVWTEWGGVIHQ